MASRTESAWCAVERVLSWLRRAWREEAPPVSPRAAQPRSTSVAPEPTPDDLDLETRLIPPAARWRRVRVKLKPIGREQARINFDPERD